MSTIKLKPGILVSLRTELRGGVEYQRTILDSAETDEDGRITRRWETTKVTQDPEEYERGWKARSQACSKIRKLCIKSAFGLICPTSKEAELADAIEQGRATAAAFNDSSKYVRVSIYALRGHIATTDEEAASAIGEEVRALVEMMNASIAKVDVEAIRDAATKALQLSEMLSEEQGEIVSEAVKAARSAARVIVSRVQKDGEDAAIVLADIKRGAIERARMAFLDLSEPVEIAPDVAKAPAANAARMSALEVGGEDSAKTGAA